MDKIVVSESNYDIIFGIIEAALVKSGYKILDGDDDTVYVRDKDNVDIDYEIKISEADSE